jgi:Fic family protein
LMTDAEVHALRHPGHHYVIEEHQASHQVVYQTARTDLLDLEREGLLHSHKSGKKLVFEGAALLLSCKW